MTEREIQHAIHRKYLTGHMMLVPNYAPFKWFECDMFGLTQSGYMREWEIKTSRADFKADAKKGKDTPGDWDTSGEFRKWKRGPRLTKYQLLADGCEHGPRQFWYVVPEDMLQPEDVPDFAGLLFVDSRHRLSEKKAAPLRHRKKVDAKIKEHVRSIMYYRFWTERGRNDVLISRVKAMKEAHDADQA